MFPDLNELRRGERFHLKQTWNPKLPTESIGKPRNSEHMSNLLGGGSKGEVGKD